MTPAMVSDIANALPQPLSAKAASSPQDVSGSGTADVVAASAKEIKSVSTDKINLSEQSRQAMTDVSKEEVKKEAATKATNGESPIRAIGEIQFVYDQKGDLSIRYMDASNKLIYQVPSELMIRMKEYAAKSDSSVDTKA
jgi:hypothetical protein